MSARRPADKAEWEKVLRAAVLTQALVDDAVLVGGTGAAFLVGHRFSADADHVVRGLVERYDDVARTLEATAGWVPARATPPVLILGNFQGVDVGIRNLIRAKPLETQSIDTPWGQLRVPTLPEMLRIKAYLVATRNATRDFIDFAALADHLESIEGPQAVVNALQALDELYPQPRGETISRQLSKQLAEPKPYDLAPDENLREYRLVDDRYADWQRLRERLLLVGEHVHRQIVCRLDPPAPPGPDLTR